MILSFLCIHIFANYSSYTFVMMPCNDTDCSVCTTQYSMMYALESNLLSLFTVWDHWKNQCCVRMSWPKLLLFHRTNCGVCCATENHRGALLLFCISIMEGSRNPFFPTTFKTFGQANIFNSEFFITLHVSIKIHSEPSVEAIKTKDFFIKIQRTVHLWPFLACGKYSEDWRKKMGKRRDLLVIQCITKKERKKVLTMRLPGVVLTSLRIPWEQREREKKVAPCSALTTFCEAFWVCKDRLLKR